MIDFCIIKSEKYHKDVEYNILTMIIIQQEERVMTDFQDVLMFSNAWYQYIYLRKVEIETVLV